MTRPRINSVSYALLNRTKWAVSKRSWVPDWEVWKGMDDHGTYPTWREAFDAAYHDATLERQEPS